MHSGATRRLFQELGVKDSANEERSSVFGKFYLSYHQSVLLESARNYGFDRNAGQTDTDLQLLSKLQHLGAATGLLDFTLDSLVALWFATATSDSEKCTGKVIVINLNDTIHFQKFSLKHEQQTLEKLFPIAPGPTGRQFFWEPRFHDEAGNRVLRQRSVFVLGRPTGYEIPPDRITMEIEIASEDKDILRKELENLFGVSEQSLFPDLHGFARANSQSTAISRLDDPDYFESQGSELYQRAEYYKSVQAYDMSIELDSKRWRSFYLRGNAKAEIKNFSGAKNDFSEALKLLESSADRSKVPKNMENRFFLFAAMFNMGNMNYNLEKYEESSANYKEAERCGMGEELGILFYNRGNVRAKLGEFEGALRDYDRAVQSNVNFAKFNKGNILIAMGYFKEALECFLDERANHTYPQLENNIAIVRKVIDHIGDRSDIVVIFEQKSEVVKGLPSVILFESQEIMLKHKAGKQENSNEGIVGITYLCSGASGNVGNFGGGEKKGGQGSEGENGFALQITW